MTVKTYNKKKNAMNELNLEEMMIEELPKETMEELTNGKGDEE